MSAQTLPSTASADRIVVGFGSRARSLDALRWAVDAAHASGIPLLVIHATDSGISVRNGPTSSVAHQLGSPTWAMVHSLVTGIAAPPDTETIVASGHAEKVLAKYVTSSDIVVLGERNRLPFGLDLKRHLETHCGCKVIRVGRYDSPQLVARPVSSEAARPNESMVSSTAAGR